MKYLYILFLVAMISCDKNSGRQVSYYYDTDSLMSSQKELLYQKNAKIIKSGSIDNNNSTGTVTPDSLEAWNREFQLFEKIDINKPVLKDVYHVSEYNDTKSNLKIREYSTNEDVEVQSLKLYYLNNLENLRRIEAVYVDKNPIFKSERNILISFDDYTGQLLLNRYMVTGTQKMIFNDSVFFKIEARIKL